MLKENFIFLLVWIYFFEILIHCFFIFFKKITSYILRTLLIWSNGTFFEKKLKNFKKVLFFIQNAQIIFSSNFFSENKFAGRRSALHSQQLLKSVAFSGITLKKGGAFCYTLNCYNNSRFKPLNAINAEIFSRHLFTLILRAIFHNYIYILSNETYIDESL